MAIYTFTDRNFANAVRRANGIGVSQNITSENTTAETVNAVSMGIKSIEGVEQLTTLKHLNINQNGVTDLSYLSGIAANILSLNCAGNPIQFISVLQNCSAILSLNIAYTGTGGMLANLSGLTTLEQLDISGNGVLTLAPIVALTHLKKLYAADNHLGAVVVEGGGVTYDSTTYGALTSFLAMEDLDLSRNFITDVASIASSDWLKYVNLSHNDIDAITELQTWGFGVNIRTLDLSNNAILGFENEWYYSDPPIYSWENLKTINLANNQMTACNIHSNTSVDVNVSGNGNLATLYAGWDDTDNVTRLDVSGTPLSISQADYLNANIKMGGTVDTAIAWSKHRQARYYGYAAQNRVTYGD
jgi:Leucine-rich repeat (LRR) protein